MPLVDHLINVHGLAYLQQATGLTDQDLARLEEAHRHDHLPYPGGNWDQHHQHERGDAP